MKRITTSDIIYEQIKNDLLSNKLNFGDKISEISLATKLNVSRTPLRDAIKRFEHEGIVMRLANGRMQIITINHQKIIEIFKIRNALENMIFKDILNDEKTILLLADNVEKTSKLIEEKKFNQAKLEVTNFTTIIYNQFNVATITNLLNAYQLIIAKFKNNTLKSNQRLIQAYTDHIHICQALQNKDYDLVCKLNDQHLNDACSELLNQI